MGVRGRGAEVDTVGGHRPAVPDDFNRAEAEVWRATVGACPPDQFAPVVLPLLKQFCRHVVTANNLRGMITKMERQRSIKIADYNKLLKLELAETKMIEVLAIRMQITPSSDPSKTKKRKAPVDATPWVTNGTVQPKERYS